MTEVSSVSECRLFIPIPLVTLSRAMCVQKTTNRDEQKQSGGGGKHRIISVPLRLLRWKRRIQLAKLIRKTACLEESATPVTNASPEAMCKGKGLGRFSCPRVFRSKVLYEKHSGRDARRFCTCVHVGASPPVILGNGPRSKCARGLLGALPRQS